MTCQYAQTSNRVAQIQLQRFNYLGNGNIIRHWFQRAWQMRNAPVEECFEPFIFTWIALNAWGECVTDQERDEAWVKALAHDQTLNDRFVGYLKGPEADETKAAADRFRSYWPIPRVQMWRRHGTLRPATNTPHDRALFFSERRIQCAPTCALEHFNAGEEIPLDWEHFLPATYRVRCNLFHGEKSPYDPSDAEIVGNAFKTLVGFMHELGHFA